MVICQLFMNCSAFATALVTGFDFVVSFLPLVFGFEDGTLVGFAFEVALPVDLDFEAVLCCAG